MFWFNSFICEVKIKIQYKKHYNIEPILENLDYTLHIISILKNTII